MNNPKNLAIIGALGMAIIVLIGTNLLFYGKSISNTTEIDTAKLKIDSLLAVIQNAEKENFILQKKNTDLTNRIVSLIDLLPQKEKEKAGKELQKKVSQ